MFHSRAEALVYTTNSTQATGDGVGKVGEKLYRYPAF